MYFKPDDDDGEEDLLKPLKKRPKTYFPWSARDLIVTGLVLVFLLVGGVMTWKIISSWTDSSSLVEDPTFVSETSTLVIEESETAITADFETEPSQITTASSQASNPRMTATPKNIAKPLLPLPLYLISRGDGIDQVWRVERDGSTLVQITHEESPVTALDVSAADGSLVYTSGNQLILARADGSDRRVLVAGEPVVPGSTQWSGRQEISSPLWSADGVFLAYGLNGVNLMTMDNGNVKTLIKNLVPERKGDKQEFYYPALFSPHASLLFTEVLYEEGNSLLVLPTVEGDPFELPGVKACCQFNFNSDLRKLIIGSGWDIGNDLGLWRYDMYEDKVEILVKDDGQSGKNKRTIIQYPKELPDGRLIYFYGQSDNPRDAPLSLVVAQSDGISDRSLVRSDSYNDIREVLWAPDASFIIIRTAFDANLRFLKIQDVPAMLLPIMGHHLRWGVLQ